MGSKLQLLEQGQQYGDLLEQQHKHCSEHLNAMFGERADIVLENVIAILGKIQAQMNAGKDPLQIAPGKEDSLKALVAGVKALQDAGPGADIVALKSYIERVKSQNQGLQPDQSEIAALKAAGNKSRVAPQIQQAFADFSVAVQSSDQKRIQLLKNQFNKLYMFYQQLYNKTNHSQSTPQNKKVTQQIPTSNGQQTPTMN